MKRKLVIVGAVGLLALAGCSDDETSSTTSSSSSGSGGSGAAAGSGGAGGGQGGAGGEGGGEEMVNGCLSTTADDQTGQLQYNIIWELPLNQDPCIKIRVDQLVGWSGDFVAHPLAGGTVEMDGTPNKDMNAIITGLDQSGMIAFHQFQEEGAYPYYCENHPNDMKGVLYVVAADGGAGGSGGTGGAGGSM